MSLSEVMAQLSQELTASPNWAVRVESVADPASGIHSTLGYTPRSWNSLPNPLSEVGWAGYDAVDAFSREHGGFNCAANPDTFHKWWPYDVLLQVASRGDHQITLIDLSRTPHMRLNVQTLINRNNCKVIRSIPLVH